MLKALDLTVSCYLLCYGDHGSWTYARLSEAMGASPSQLHAAIGRARRCHLMSTIPNQDWQPHRRALKEFCLHGLRYVFPAEYGPPSRGWKTASLSGVLGNRLFAGADEKEVVWPDPQGPHRGVSLEPLHVAVLTSIARTQDPAFYHLMSLLDLIRTGQTRELAMARDAFGKWVDTRGQ